MALIAEGALLIAGLTVLWFAGDRGVRYSMEISEMLGISSFIIGFLVISISTGLPEIVTVILASIQGVGELSAGNLIGSSMVNMSLILGITAIAAGGMKVDLDTERELLKILLVTIILVSTLLLLTKLAWWHGILLIISYIVSVYYLSSTDIIKKIVKEEEKEAEKDLEQDIIGTSEYAIFLKFFASLGLLILGGKLVIDSAVTIGTSLGLNLETLGATVIALGTGLPELSLELNSVKHREYELALGDLFGSTLVNLTLILGLFSILGHPQVAILPLTSAIGFLAVTLGYIWWKFHKTHEIQKKTGFILLGIFIIYLLEEYGLVYMIPLI